MNEKFARGNSHHMHQPFSDFNPFIPFQQTSKSLKSNDRHNNGYKKFGLNP
jgi:hypothetical protein